MVITEKKCCGCSACVNICPQNSIKMIQDNEGFYYPQINNEICSNCQLCKKVCPLNNLKSEVKFDYKYVGGYNLSLELRKKSSSGGIFVLLAEFILKQGGRVFGAGYDNDFNIVHTYIDNIADIDKLLGSKYVQSDMHDCFKVVKDSLIKGKSILFSGTPCQIAGLKSYLGKYAENENLYYVSVFCHGVPSPKVWKLYLKQFNSNITQISFRDKKEGWNKFCFYIKFESGREKREPFADNIFMKGFLNNLFLRPSCYECKFKHEFDVSDISLGDFWGVEKERPQLYDNKGCSVVVSKSEKGDSLIQKVLGQVYWEKIEYSDFVLSNPSYLKPVNYNPKREKFFQLLNKDCEVVASIEKCIRDSLLIRIKIFLYKLVKRVKNNT